MAKYASQIVKQAQAWVGKNEKDGSFKEIIDVYNSHKPLARGYKVKYTDEWCSTFVSAVSIKCGMTDILPTECGCEKHTKLFKNIDSWIENENRTPNPGDVIFYDWNDTGSGDDKGSADHVGIVEKVSNGTITVIEGNYNQAVARRTIKVNAKYIRGYGVPKYDKEPEVKPVTNPETTKPTNNTTTKLDDAKSFNSAYKHGKGYTVSASVGLHLRTGASILKKSLCVMPKGTKVMWYGYYTGSWKYVKVTTGKYKGLVGFCSQTYLK